MKNKRVDLSVYFALVLGFLCNASNATPLPNPTKPVLVTVLPNKVFVPNGFDDNDNAQVVIHGEFPNTCYKTGPTEVTVNEEAKEIRITNKAYFYNGCWCMDVQVPWSQIINVGVLSVSKYKIFAETKQGGFNLISNLDVNPATNPGPDDFPYAPVSEASVSGANTPGSKKLALKGIFNTTCMSFKEQPKVRVQPDNVIVVLPIVEIGTQGCQPARIPFEVEVDLGTQKGETLLHIRSLNGNSINQFVDFI